MPALLLLNRVGGPIPSKDTHYFSLKKTFQLHCTNEHRWLHFTFDSARKRGDTELDILERDGSYGWPFPFPSQTLIASSVSQTLREQRYRRPCENDGLASILSSSRRRLPSLGRVLCVCGHHQLLDSLTPVLRDFKSYFSVEEIAIPVHSNIEASYAAHPIADVFINFASYRSAAASSIDDFDVGFVRSLRSLLPISVNLGFLGVHGLLSRVWERKGASLLYGLLRVWAVTGLVGFVCGWVFRMDGDTGRPSLQRCQREEMGGVV
ncbi:hypothetical protein ACFX1R_034924 [Malus domestica]|uniref:Uncharacterized protein n=1 Tax=Malus domestica TaxID=3750 RepID=A0A498K2P8_MALDO|nr:hypothetical protein DVH24_015036 [Malus domestica]